MTRTRHFARTSSKKMTEDFHGDQTNINSIMRKYHRSGVLPQHMEGFSYGDFTGVEDFHETQNRIIAAQDAFMTLPSDLRKRMDNDPGKFVEFYQDPENAVELVEMGLLPKEALKDVHGEKASEKVTEAVKKKATEAKDKKADPQEKKASD